MLLRHVPFIYRILRTIIITDHGDSYVGIPAYDSRKIDIYYLRYIVCKSNLVLKPTDLPYAHLFRAVNIPLDDKSMRTAGWAK